MATTTPNLSLLKKDPITDGSDTFNIGSMLNDNWDKIDAAIADKETATGAQAKADVAETKAKAYADKHWTDYVRQPGYISPTKGTSTDYTGSTTPALSAYAEGVGVTIIPHVDCGASPTFNWDNKGAIALLKQDGTAYGSGELTAGKPYTFKKVGTSFLADSSSGSSIQAGTASVVIDTGETITAGALVSFIDGKARASDKSVWSKLSAGISTVFKSTSSAEVSATALDNTRVLVAWSDEGNSNYGTAIVLTVFGRGVMVGTPVVFKTAKVLHLSTKPLNSTQALVAFADSANSYYGTAVVLTVTGTTIAVGTSVVFKTATCTNMSAVVLDSTRVLVAFVNTTTGTYGTAVVLTITGTVITVGTPVVFESSATSYVAATAIDNTRILVAFHCSYKAAGTSVILTISGTTITKNVAATFTVSPTSIAHVSATTLDSTHVLVAFVNMSGSTYGTAVVLTITGTTILAGTPVVFKSASSSHTSVVTIDSTHVFLAFAQSGEGGVAMILTVSGSMISVGASTVYRSTSNHDISAMLLDSTRALVVFSDVGNEFRGSAVVVSSGTAPEGLAKQSGIAGDTREFYVF